MHVAELVFASVGLADVVFIFLFVGAGLLIDASTRRQTLPPRETPVYTLPRNPQRKESV
jgi:hypothetical protein